MEQRFLYDDSRLVPWAAAQIGVRFPEDSHAIGIERDGEIVVSVVYDRFTGNDICMHVAAKPGVMWVRREAMHRFFAYPFLQLGCNRVTGLVAATNLTARKFDEHIGFVQEGVLREGLPNGEALIVYGMLRAECRWINR
jgi:hypothetical protein